MQKMSATHIVKKLSLIVGAILMLAGSWGCESKRGWWTMEMTKLKGIFHESRLYAEANGGKFPSSIYLLRPSWPHGGPPELMFEDGETGIRYDWLYFPANYSTLKPENIVAAAPRLDERGMRIVLCSDGSAMIIAESFFIKNVRDVQ